MQMSEARFLDTPPACDVGEFVSLSADAILDRRKNLATLHETITKDPENGGLFQKHKVLVVPGSNNSDVSIILPPAWTSGPDMEGQTMVASAIAEITGHTVIVPMFPGMGGEGAGYSKLSRPQKENLLSGSYQNVAESQWQAMLQVEKSPGNTADDFLSGGNRKIVLFGHSMGNSENAGLLAQMPEDLQEKLAGIIWSETPDVSHNIATDLIIPTVKNLFGGGNSIGALAARLSPYAGLTYQGADLASRLKQSENSPPKYGVRNAALDPRLDWRREKPEEFNRRLNRDRVALLLGPLAMVLGSIGNDLKYAHQEGLTTLADVPQAIFRGGIRSTTLDPEQVKLRQMLEQEAGATIAHLQTFEGEDHAYADSLVMNIYIVLKALEKFGIQNSKTSS
jgi:hypothetical protein